MRRRFAIGGFGCGNLGDDAIFLGMRKFFGKDLIRVFILKRIENSDFSISRLANKLQEEDTVLFGGGYIFRNDESININWKLAKILLKKGIKIEVRGADISEDLTLSSQNQLKELFSQCSYLEFRSISSVEKAEQILHNTQKINFRKDYSFFMGGEIGKIKEEFDFSLLKGKPLIGISLNRQANKFLKDISKVCKIFQNKICFVGIPHCHHFNSEGGKDSFYLNQIRNLEKISFPILPWENLSPQGLKGFYSYLDGIITTRLHGLYFGISYSKPILVLEFDRIRFALRSLSLLKDNYNPRLLRVSKDFSLNAISNFVEDIQDGNFLGRRSEKT